MFGLSGTQLLVLLLVLILLAGAAWKLVRLFRSFWRRWARKDLRPGDLTALGGSLLAMAGGAALIRIAFSASAGEASSRSMKATSRR
jgi:hypothetical protein